MCLAYPARIVEIELQETLLMGTVDFGGVRTSVCLEWLPEARVGDYVIVHVGFAISKLDERDAMETLRLLNDGGGTDAVH